MKWLCCLALAAICRSHGWMYSHTQVLRTRSAMHHSCCARHPENTWNVYACPLHTFTRTTRRRQAVDERQHSWPGCTSLSALERTIPSVTEPRTNAPLTRFLTFDSRQHRTIYVSMPAKSVSYRIVSYHITSADITTTTRPYILASARVVIDPHASISRCCGGVGWKLCVTQDGRRCDMIRYDTI